MSENLVYKGINTVHFFKHYIILLNFLSKKLIMGLMIVFNFKTKKVLVPSVSKMREKIEE